MIEATGIFSQPYKIATLLSYSATWQELCHTADQDEARSHIHMALDGNTEGADNNPENLPLAVINWQDQDSFSRTAESPSHFVDTGTVTMVIWLRIPDDYEFPSDDAQIWFMNQIGAIINEMEVLQRTGEPVAGETHIAVRGFSQVDGPWRDDAENVEILDPENYEQPRRYWIVFSVEYF